MLIHGPVFPRAQASTIPGGRSGDETSRRKSCGMCYAGSRVGTAGPGSIKRRLRMNVFLVPDLDDSCWPESTD